MWNHKGIHTDTQRVFELDTLSFITGGEVTYG